jgi:hypothetical protein
MATRIRSPRAARLAIRFGSVWLLSLVLARGVGAGQPAALTDDSSRPSTTTHAAADTSKKAATKPATTAKKTAAKPGAATKTTLATTPASVAKTPTVATKAPSISKGAVAPKTTVASKTPTVATTPASKPVMATVAPAPAKSGPASASSRGATMTAKPTPRQPAVSSNAATMAKSVTPVSKPPVVAPQTRTVALQKNAALSPTVSRTPTTAVPGGPKLAQSGGTVVRGPLPGSPGAKDLTVGPPVPVNGAGAHPAGKGATAANASETTRLRVTTPNPSRGGVSKTGSLTAPAPLEEHVSYQYNALGRRDPFQSLIDGGWVGDDVGGDAPPDVGGLKLVGIVWGANDRFAMCEDARGNSYVLRRGDRVMNGTVEGLKQDAMIVSITVDGQSESVTIPITRKGEKANANR